MSSAATPATPEVVPPPAKISQENITPEWFLNLTTLEEPKALESLTSLWDHMTHKQAVIWGEKRGLKNGEDLLAAYQELLVENPITASSPQEKREDLDRKIDKMELLTLYGITRIIHVKTHLKEIDMQAVEAEKPREQIIPEGKEQPLKTTLVLQTFLEYLNQFGDSEAEESVVEKFTEFVNGVALRLVSTVHPNETERNINLLHYTALLDKYIEWKKDHESMKLLDMSAPEYRIRREKLNHLRREMKAEIEGAWQSDFMRPNTITVQSEARRIMNRYDIMFETVPLLVKFIKHLVKEAYFLWLGSRYAKKVPKFLETFAQVYKHTDHSRRSRLRAIKRSIEILDISHPPVPRLKRTILKFSTWKGGDRDGNPFVVAAFSNQTFVEQKQFVLQHYLKLANELIDKLTPSLSHVNVTEELHNSLLQDRTLFPYIEGIKPQEPYRAKLRYIIEKLSNTLSRTNDVVLKAGETVKPLLSLSLPGPTGYNNSKELQKDIKVLYMSLLQISGKAQARSLLQNFKIAVQTFGFSLSSIDFRQTSSKNSEALAEYLKLAGNPQASQFKKMEEPQKQKFLLELLLSRELTFNPWIIQSLSKISKDTFESMVIFADAAAADRTAVGKFIISMCQAVSDLLVVLMLLKLTGMLKIDEQGEIICDQDVTGLFETIDDLKRAPSIVSGFLSIPVIRRYVSSCRSGKLTVMLGYSDSNRDGSSLASDAHTAKAPIELKKTQDQLNQADPTHPIKLVFYRGRGDTIPRGFGGSVKKAIASQSYTSFEEDITEQNRYLRKYSTISSALDHMHTLYSAHLSTAFRKPHVHTDRYLTYFEFFGSISNVKWNQLVKTEHGKVYFDILGKYSILPILSYCCFASRPVTREGVRYDIENIRAIPFTMFLAQMREFSNGYYGTGTAFENGTLILSDARATAASLLKITIDQLGSKSSQQSAVEEVTKALQGSGSSLSTAAQGVIKLVKAKHGVSATVEQILASCNPVIDQVFAEIIKLYLSPDHLLEDVTFMLNDLEAHGISPLGLLREMYASFAPFQYSIENKESALLIRQREIVEDYCHSASEDERAVLNETEKEASLTKKWVLAINQRKHLKSNTAIKTYDTPELLLLHKFQSRFLRKATELRNAGDVNTADMKKLIIYIQMTILAISEALGFGG